MSRIGREPIELPEGVTVTIDGADVAVTGPNGELTYTLIEGIAARQDDGSVVVEVVEPEAKQFWGLSRTLIANMVEGVKNGFEKKLKIMGVGYNAKTQGNKLVLNLGYSHPIEHELPETISVEVEKNSKGDHIVLIKGPDKQQVGEHAATIRSYRPPEPYKGKGVRYFDEYVKIKPGKTAVKEAGAGAGAGE